MNTLRDLTLAIIGKDKTKDATDSAAQNFDKLTDKVGQSNTGLQKFGTGLGNLVTPALVAGAAVAGFGALSVNAFADFERSMNLAAEASGATGAEMERLGDLAKKLGADTVFGAGEAAGALLELAKGGLKPAQIEAGALENTMNLAAAGGLELADAAVTVVGAMGAFGISADKTAQVANALAGAANSSSTNVSELSQGLAQVGSQANLAHMTLQQTVGVLGAFADAGIRGSDAGTSLKTMLQRLVPQTKEAATEMKGLGINFTNADGSFKSIGQVADILRDKMSKLTDEQKAQSLQTIFGSDATRAAEVLMRQGADGIQKYVDAASDQTAAQKMADAAMQGTSGSIEKMKGALETASVSFGEMLAPAVTKTAQVLATTFDWMTQNKSLVLGLGGAIAFFAGTILALNVGLKIYEATIAAVTVAKTIWTGVQWLLNTALFASPITWIVLGIVALVAAIVWVATKTTWFQQIWEHVWGFLKAVGAWFAGPFVDFFRGPIGFIVGYFQFLGSIVLWLWDNILSPVFGLIGAVFRMVWELSIKPVVDFVVSYLQFLGGVVLWLWDSVFSPVFGFIADVVLWLWDSIIAPYIGFIAGIFLWLWEHAVKPAFDFIIGYFRLLGAVALWLWDNAVKPAVDFIVGGVAHLASAWKSNVEKITGFINSFTDNVRKAREWVAEQIGKIADAFQALPGKIGSFLSGIADKIINAFKGAFNWVSDHFNSLIRGANTVIGALNKVPGVNLSLIPGIPKFHSGGTFHAPAGMSEGLAILRDGERVLTPGQSDEGGGGVVMYGDVHITVDPTKFRTIDDFLTWLENLKNNSRRGLVVTR